MNLTKEILLSAPVPPMEVMTREIVQAMIDREILKHKLQYHQEANSCDHAEVLPVGEFTMGDIGSINGFKKVQPVEGKIYRHLMDYPDEIEKYRTIIMFNN